MKDYILKILFIIIITILMVTLYPPLLITSIICKVGGSTDSFNKLTGILSKDDLS